MPGILAALILAAGDSQRFGAPKMLADVRGEPLVRRTVSRVLRARVEHVAVVIGVDANAHAVRRALDGLPVEIVVNERHSGGMGSSIAAGVRALPDTVTAAVIVLADQPSIDPGLLNRLREAHEAGAAIAFASYGEERAPPVLFARTLFDELSTLEGDTGARRVMERHGDGAVAVDAGESEPLDVDTREDLRRLLERSDL